ncbi:MAG: SRPBCC family protein [Solirubrobacterales bacterium]
MGPISAEVEVDVPRERAFALLADLAARPSFADHFLTGYRLTRIDPVGIGAGARFRVEVPLRPVWMDTTIVELDGPHKIVERGSSGRSNRIATNTVWELTGGGGSRTTVRVVFWTEPANPLDRAVELLSGGSFFQRRGWEQALRRLRDQLESEAPVAARLAVAGGNRHTTGVP